MISKKRFLTITSITKRISVFVLATYLCLSCAPFSVLPETINDFSEIEGVYRNDSYPDFFTGQRLWSLIDFKNSIPEVGLRVRIKILNKNRLSAQLLRGNDIITEKIIKGSIKKDKCFYTRRIFYFIPVLPILFMYNNSQTRYYIDEGFFVIEKTQNNAGAVIIFASGNKHNHKWQFEKINE